MTPAAAPPERFYRCAAGHAAMMAWYDAALHSLAVPVQTQTVRTEAGCTHLLTAGAPDAPPLVLLHGINVNALNWARQIERLAGHFRLIVPDVPGYAGRSAAVRLPYPGDAVARWLAGVLDALGVERVALAGASGGGQFALKFAAFYPARTRALALVNPCGLARYRWPLGLLRSQPMLDVIGWCGQQLASSGLAARLARANASPQAAPAEATLALAYLLLRHYRRRRPPGPLPAHELRCIQAPTLLLLGERDPYFAPAVLLRRARRLLPDLRAEVLPDAGHDMHNDRADAVGARLIAFFTPIPACSGSPLSASPPAAGC